MARGTVTPDQDLGPPIEYDPNFKGPLHSRSCTDILCLLLFIVFIACWTGIGLYAYVNGDPETLLIPRDSKFARCGFDAHVIDKPYLVFFDLTKCLNPSVAFTGCDTTQVCVKSCPTETFLLENANTTQLANMICVDGVKTPTNLEDAKKLVDSNQCARWYLPSKPELKRCLPAIRDIDFSIIEKSRDSALSLINKDNLESAMKNIKLVEKTKQLGSDMIDDIEASWKEILGGLVLGMVACILYIAMMRWIANVMVWLSIFGIIGLLSFCVYFTSKSYLYYKDHPYVKENSKTAFEKYLKTEEFWLILLIIVSVVLALLVFIIIFLRKRIVLAIGLIKEGSKAVSAATSTLFFPIVPWVLQMAIVVFAISVGLYLSSTGKPHYEIRGLAEHQNCACKDNATSYTADGVECTIQTVVANCEPHCSDICKFIKMDTLAIITYLHVFNVFGFFWAVFFISALGEMILAATFATWYWTFHKSEVPFFTLTAAALRTLRYHIGTLAFGSLIIAICRMIRCALEYIDHKLKKYDNEITKAVLCCLKCFFWCLENFLKFINKNAYIMCAIHGKNFCTSAKDAFSLLMRNIVRVFVLDKVTDFLFFLSKLLVTIGVGFIVYAFLEYVSEKKLNYNISPVIFVAICTYLICSVFFGVYTMAVDTLFLCFLEDCERNDGSQSKPYYMSKNLMNVLGKKNKTS